MNNNTYFLKVKQLNVFGKNSTLCYNKKSKKEANFMKLKVIGTSCTWFERNNTSFVIDKDIVFGGEDKPIYR